MTDIIEVMITFFDKHHNSENMKKKTGLKAHHLISEK